MRSGIESLIKLPLQIPLETSQSSTKEPGKNFAINKSVNTNEEKAITITPDQSETYLKSLSKGYIKYPQYDFF